MVGGDDSALWRDEMDSDASYYAVAYGWTEGCVDGWRVVRVYG